MTRRFTLAHLSDVHLAPVRGFYPWRWNVKRLLGYANWIGKRRARHSTEVANQLVRDALEQRADHIAITGDLVNLGLPEELAAAQAWLKGIAPAETVSVVPGNHDIYARQWSRDAGVERWRAYMSSCRWGKAFEQSVASEAEAYPRHHPGEGPPFPYVRRVGDIVLVGLNSACPTPPARAWGRLGRGQVKRAAELLRRLGADGHFRCVLIHHPPHRQQASAGKRLRDAHRLERVLGEVGAELVLHGHNHVDMIAKGAERDGRPLFTSVGVPSASMSVRHPREPLGRYNLYQIEPAATGWNVMLVRRGLAEPGGPVVEIERMVLSGMPEVAQPANAPASAPAAPSSSSVPQGQSLTGT